MRVFTRVDLRELQRTHALTRRASGPAALEALKDLVAPRLRLAIEETRRRAYDTGRIVQALERAYNMIGRGTVPLTPIRASRFAKEYLKKFQQDFERLSVIEQKMQARRKTLQLWGRTRSDAYRKNEKNLIRIGRVLDRLADNIRRVDAEPDAIVIGGFGGANGRRRAAGAFRLSNVAQVVTKLYGGSMTFSAASGSPRATLTVREPHARLVDKRTRVISRSMIGAAPVGRNAALHRFVREMQARGGWERNGAAGGTAGAGGGRRG